MAICDHDCFRCPWPDCVVSDDLTDAEAAESAERDRMLVPGSIDSRTYRFRTDPEYREEVRQKRRAYYQANKERFKATQQKYRENNTEHIKAKKHEYYLLHKQEYAERRRRYYRAHREEILSREAQKYKEKKAAASAGTETTAQG